jgi:hypothetical protein
MFNLFNYSPLSSFPWAARQFSTIVNETQPVSTPAEAAQAARKTRRDFFKEVGAHDHGGSTNNRHVLAKRIKDSGLPITQHDINSLLDTGQDQITDQVFQYLDALTLDSASITCPLPLSNADRLRLNKVVGSTEPDSAIRVSGVYLFRDINTGELLYVGSSKHLGARGPQHLVPSRQKNAKGPWGDFVRSNPLLSGVTISFIVLPSDMTQHYISLEQLFLLKYPSLFNVLLLATPGGDPLSMTEEGRIAQIKVQGHQTHMYLADRSARVHSFLSTRDAAKQLGSINHNSIAKGMRLDRPVKGFYFSKDLLVNVPDNILPIEELRISITSAPVLSGRKSGF